MWIGSYPGDEFFTAGLFRSLIRDRSIQCTIVLLQEDPELSTLNLSAKTFLNQCQYVQFKKNLYTCGSDLTKIEATAKMMQEQGIIKKISKSIQERKPDIIITFDPENGYYSQCDNAVTSILAKQALVESKIGVNLYYVLNKERFLTNKLGANSDDKTPTDVFILKEENWLEKIKLFELYSSFNTFIKKLFQNKEYMGDYQYKEFYYKVR